MVVLRRGQRVGEWFVSERMGRKAVTRVFRDWADACAYARSARVAEIRRAERNAKRRSARKGAGA